MRWESKAFLIVYFLSNVSAKKILKWVHVFQLYQDKLVRFLGRSVDGIVV